MGKVECFEKQRTRMKTTNYKGQCFFALLVGIIVLGSVSAEQPIKLWDRTAGGGDLDVGNGVAVDSNDNIIVTGVTGSTAILNDRNADVWTIKYDSDGNVIWDKMAGGSDVDHGYDVAVDSNNNIIVTGYTESFGAGNKDFWTIKYDSDGNMLWNKTADGSEYDRGHGVAVDSNNNIVVTGVTGATGYSDSEGDLWTIKYDANGTMLWNKTIGGSGDDAGRGVAVDSNNNIVVTGDTNSFGAGEWYVWTIKYDSDGNTLWNKTAGGIDHDAGNGVAVDSNDNIIVTGDTNSFGAENADVWTIKYDSNGNLLWSKTAGGSGGDISYGVAVDSNDNIIVTGLTNSFGAGRWDVWTIKYRVGEFNWPYIIAVIAILALILLFIFIRKKKKQT